MVVDAEGLNKFNFGLGTTLLAIQEQVHWIGKEYGGTAYMLATKRLPPIIANDIFAIRDQYSYMVSHVAPLVQQTPDRLTVFYLYGPFLQNLVTPSGKTMRNWMTWATKFWHFLKPDTFPIMDSRARKFFLIPIGNDPIDAYVELLIWVRHTMIEKADWLPQMRLADCRHAWSDIKLWDKVAYQLGQ